MKEALEQLRQEFEKATAEISDISGLEAIENSYFSRKSGKITNLMKQIANLSIEERKVIGNLANQIKRDMEATLARKRASLMQSRLRDLEKTEAIDVTQPYLPPSARGTLHPTTQVQIDLEDLFTSMGFMITDGPELESDYYNFEALNIPSNHPARDMQDTFYIKGKPNWVMRTHTSSAQVRAMRKFGAPLRLIVPGRCFRNEATDVRHEHTFNQLEGVIIDRHISLAHLKGVLETMARHLFGPQSKLRLRPKFYPFVEPGVNGEVTCFLCQGKGCRVCKQTGWLEIFGAGMIHPKVLTAGGINPKKYRGFAFGLGLTRLVMLKYGIDDIRLLHSGDLRFLEKF